MRRDEMERRFAEVFNSCWNPGDLFEAVMIFNHCLRSTASRFLIDAQSAQHEINTMRKEIRELKQQLRILPKEE